MRSHASELLNASSNREKTITSGDQDRASSTAQSRKLKLLLHDLHLKLCSWNNQSLYLQRTEQSSTRSSHLK